MRLNNRYEYNPKTDLLGSGGFGRVYLARDTFLDIDVALKIVNADDFPEHYSLIKEVKKGILLNHTNLVRYLDAFELNETTSFGEEQNWQVAVMEYVPNGELSSAIFQKLSSEQQHNLVTQLLDGLNYLHKEGIIHRDLKPSNILLLKRNNEYIPKICDFGISKQITGKSSQLSQTIGSPSYVPPEYFDNDKRVSFGSDLWSLGVLLYELFIGTPAFGSEASGHSTGDILKNIITCNISSEINSIPEPFQLVIKQCLVKDRKERVQSCDVLIDLFIESYQPLGKILLPDYNTGKRINTKTKKLEVEKNNLSDYTIKLMEQDGLTLEKKGNNIRIDYIEDVSFDLVHIEGGNFNMGCDKYVNSKPEHKIFLDKYYIGKYPVSQELWEVVMGNNPSYFQGENLPVERVSWNDTMFFLKKLNQKTGKNYRLPTEAEWEFAAADGNKSSSTSFAGSNNIKTVAWYDINSKGKTQKIESKKPNKFGLYGMSGNVAEWCSDWYDVNYYKNCQKNNPQGPPIGSHRVERGGSFSSKEGFCRVAARSGTKPQHRRNNIGFRLAHSVVTKQRSDEKRILESKGNDLSGIKGSDIIVIIITIIIFIIIIMILRSVIVMLVDI